MHKVQRIPPFASLIVNYSISMAHNNARPNTFKMRSERALPKPGGYTPAVRISAHTHDILVACSLIVVPMILFTSVSLALVFSNTSSNQGCSFDDLCPTAGLINATSNNYYYVDFSATSLVFISSWSSTISFALIGILINVYAYSVAAQILHHPDLAPQHGNSLRPFQLSLMLKVLNAEVLSLWSLLQPLGRKSLRKTNDQESHQTISPRPLRRSLVVFGVALFGWYVCLGAVRNPSSPVKRVHSGCRYLLASCNESNQYASCRTPTVRAAPAEQKNRRLVFRHQAYFWHPS
jgi:hypothetical protein